MGEGRRSEKNGEGGRERGGGGRKSGGRRSHVFLDEVDQPGLFERACGPTMPTSGATATHFTSSIIPSTFPCGRGAGRRGGEGRGAIPSLPPSLLERCQQHRVARKLPMLRRYTAKGSPAHRPLLKDRSSATPRNSLRGK